ncbi:MAG TPA: transposase [Candidatus Kapabacteria bacterium]|nr:transposase [Candidatus Kapabacteria bacterium]
MSYSLARAKKDKHNREKGLKRLEKKIKSNKLSKKDINNKGYNKYLKMSGEIKIEIDYQKYEEDAKWDGIKGYVTNTTLVASSVIDNYKELWNIERAFRMSKTDLRIRPIYHRIRRRIEAHICISFVAYSIYKDLERVLKLKKSEISVRNAYELTQNIYQMEITLPESNLTEKIMLKLSDKQQELINIINEFF